MTERGQMLRMASVAVVLLGAWCLIGARVTYLHTADNTHLQKRIQKIREFEQPLLVGRGAGAEMRYTLGVAVFSGMLGVTLFGLVFTPLFFQAIEWVVGGPARRDESGVVGEDGRSAGRSDTLDEASREAVE